MPYLQHQVLTGDRASGSRFTFRLSLPPIKQVIYEISLVHMGWEAEPAVSAICITHHLEQNPSGTVDALLNIPGGWAFTQAHPVVLPFNPPMTVAGSQDVHLFQTSGSAATFLVVVYFTTRRVPLLEWTELMSKTSYAEGSGPPSP